MDVELRHLRAFVAVAEELNFTRAATRLHVVQQALSAQIRQLEDRLGVQVVERTTRRVALTAAGRELYPRAVALLAAVEEAGRATRAAAAERVEVVLGFVAPLDVGPMQPVLGRLSEDEPGIEVTVRFADLLDPTGGLRRGESDVAKVYGPFDTTGLELLPLWTEPRGVAVGATHPFAARDAITIEELVAEPTFDFPTADARWREFWTASAHRGGRPPYIAAQYRSLDALLEAVRAGLGVHITTQPLVRSTTGIAWVPVEGLEPLEHFLAWRAGDERPGVAALVAAARAVSEELAGVPPH
ncbi:LysR family transcriptional regulator [Svornostia abyssi]|uniref:LysR family transcriptional regulator n=1 Tax=Svornostia abyssi TaxID=2898438 RepID=A0ABY5PJ08_9ACTN|nr:LysR family transcriptional regulator [Parviterribacteraceae bacterium J379]